MNIPPSTNCKKPSLLHFKGCQLYYVQKSFHLLEQSNYCLPWSASLILSCHTNINNERNIYHIFEVVFIVFGGSEWFNDPLSSKGCWQTGIGNLRSNMVPHPSLSLLLRNTSAKNKTSRWLVVLEYSVGLNLCLIHVKKRTWNKKLSGNSKICHKHFFFTIKSVVFCQCTNWHHQPHNLQRIKWISTFWKCRDSHLFLVTSKQKTLAYEHSSLNN